MAFTAKAFQVLICSPSDVQEERDVIEKTVHAVNALHAHDMGTVLLPVRWETHTSPRLGDRPQAIINKQIVDSCDILVAVFWTRIGTPTGVAESGSVEEIKEFMTKGKPVLLYFSEAPVAMASVDRDQYDRLIAFREEFKKKGLIENYSDIAGFSDKLFPHLVRTVRELYDGTSVGSSKSGGFATPRVDRSGSVPSADLPSPLAALGLTGHVNLSSFNFDYNHFVRQSEVEWTAERDSEPHNTTDGKLILRKIDRKLVDFRTHPAVYDHPEIASGLDAALRSVRTLQRHQTFMDGGRSFRQFWDAGNAIIDDLKQLAVKIQERTDAQR